MTAQLLDLARGRIDHVRALRRELHRHPEVGSDLPRTKALVLRELRRLGLKVREDVGGGIVADLEAGDPDRGMTALRADMDALPMQEETGLEFASAIPGQAHTCGHDLHTAMLLGAAELLYGLRTRLPAGVRFIFQPNEENQPGGARFMVEAGCLEGVREIFGLHVWPGEPVGWFGTRPGPFMARPDVFSVTVTGKGGHASAPHSCNDPVLAASHMVTMLQSIVSRRIPAGQRAVLSVTRFQAGSTYNIIPDTAFLQGTVRTLSEETAEQVQREMRVLVESTAAALGVRAELDYEGGFPVVVNAPASTSRATAVLRGLTDRVDGELAPTMAGEDFSYYLRAVPGCFLFMGCGPCALDGHGGLHNARFNPDEDCLPYGVAALTALALEP